MKKLMTFLTVLTVLTIYSCGPRTEGLADCIAFASSDIKEQDIDGVIPTDKKIIKEGRLRFRTTDISKTKSLIIQTVQELNGYIANENSYDYSDDYSNKLEHRLTIRVPADKFDILLCKISENVEKLDSKDIEVKDVTEEYIDIEARIKTKKELQNRYIELLKRATIVEEILKIEKEIGNLQTEIESVEGRMKYLKDKIAFSTLTIVYYQNITSAFGFSSEIIKALKSGWNGFLWFIVGLAHTWVFILIAIGIVFFFIKYRRKKKKRVERKKTLVE